MSPAVGPRLAGWDDVTSQLVYDNSGESWLLSEAEDWRRERGACRSWCCDDADATDDNVPCDSCPVVQFFLLIFMFTICVIPSIIISMIALCFANDEKTRIHLTLFHNRAGLPDGVKKLDGDEMEENLSRLQGPWTLKMRDSGSPGGGHYRNFHTIVIVGDKMNFEGDKERKATRKITLWRGSDSVLFLDNAGSRLVLEDPTALLIEDAFGNFLELEPKHNEGPVVEPVIATAVPVAIQAEVVGRGDRVVSGGGRRLRSTQGRQQPLYHPGARRGNEDVFLRNCV